MLNQYCGNYTEFFCTTAPQDSWLKKKKFWLQCGERIEKKMRKYRNSSYELFNQFRNMIIAFSDWESIRRDGKIQEKFKAQN